MLILEIDHCAVVAVQFFFARSRELPVFVCKSVFLFDT